MRLAASLLCLLALAGCGGHARSAEDVARAWSAALNRDDDEAAAKLFARGARIIQEGDFTLDTRRDAVMWNAALPCGGTITRVIRQSKTDVVVVFHLKERPRHACDGPGKDAAALFRVEHGKIVLWHQTAVPGESPGQVV